MRLKTAIITGFLITLMVLLVTVISANQELLESPFDLLGVRLPTSWVLAMALMAGFLSFAVWLAATGVSQLSRRWLLSLSRHGEREAELRYLKGLDAALGGRPLEAIHQFQRALEAKPNYLPALLKLGDSYRAVERVAEAVDCHRQALAEHPQDLPSLYALAEDHLAGGDHEEAKRCLHEIIKIQPKRALKALRTLRNLYIREGNWKRAQEVQEHILDARVLPEEREQDAPFTPGILHQIGVDLMEQEKYREAIQQFERVRKKHPAFIPSYLRLAEACLLDGREEDAVASYLDGYRKANAPECLLAMERLYLEKGVPEEAIKRYQHLVASTDRKVLPKFLLGRLYYRLEMLEKADTIFREIEGSIGDSGILHFFMGRIRERKGEMAGACEKYRRLIRILNPFELSFRCSSCGDKRPDWRGFCPRCLAWDTFHPDFKDDLMQEIQEARPIYYEEIAWKRESGAPSS